MTEIMMDGEPLEVGDEVYCLSNGKGMVSEITDDPHFPICIDFEEDNFETYNKEFKRFSRSLTRELYWQKPEIIPPPKLKKKIKVWDWFIQGTNLQCWILYGVSEVPKDVLIQITQKIDGTEREVER